MIHRLALATALFTATLFAQTAPAPNPHPYTQLYVFGDSYSDSGSGYLDTNGPTAVAYLARRLGIPFTWYGDPNSKGKGLNFAISGAGSGAGAGRRYPTGEMLGIGMQNQVDNFLAFTKSKDIPPIDAANTMFFFAGGLNDRGKPEGYTRTNIEHEIDQLYDLGARRFMVAILPTKIRQFATAGTQFNPELAKIPDEERAKHPDIRIANSNWGAFLDEVITNPAQYGITDTTKPCAGRAIHHEDTTPCATPDAYFFYHEGHPSTAVHRAVGDMLYKEATATLSAQSPATPSVAPAPTPSPTAPAPTRPFTQLYVFGDSYSDTGAGFPLADGPTAVAYLAQHFSIPFTYYGDPNFKDQGLNFSVSGAKTGSVPPRPDATGESVAHGMKEQVDQFVALLKSGQIKFDPAQTMFFFAGGLNDRKSPDGYTRTNEEDEIDTLYALGARRFLVALLPTQIPVFATAGTQFNPELAKIPAEEFAKHSDIRIANSNWGPFFDEVITHPDQYGLTNTTTPCSTLARPPEKPVVCDTPSAYFYYFAAHPSTAAHRAVGDMLYKESLTAP